ncbi:MAG TPA: zf-HC2 domain-containing protein, partial [Thermoanaerobaculia bacterium]|nr:zf-HC2 domain-containing protein [Thermoanaerobaculia bacterium]
MNEFNHPSPEALAAFVDGRLSGDPRDQVMAHLDRCRDCYEVFAETVRFQRQEEPRGRVLRPARFGAPQWVWW